MITRIAQCLPESLANAAYDYSSAINWKYGWRSNNNMGYGHWNQDVTRGVYVTFAANCGPLSVSIANTGCEPPDTNGIEAMI